MKVSELSVEKRLHLKEIHPDLFGTADAVIYYPDSRRLMVIDYKHGAGVPVDVVDNVQLMYYALGAAMDIGMDKVDTVEIVVVQPRCDHADGPIRSQVLDIVDLQMFAHVLKKAALATDDPKAPVVSGSWCRWCKAKGKCPVLEKEALSAAAVDFNVIKANPDKLAEALSKVEAVDAWVKAVRSYAYQEALHGREPTGFKLVAKRAVRKWEDTSQAVKVLTLYGLDDVDMYKAKELKTPPQIEKVIGAANKEDIAHLVTKVSSGTTLVSNDDKREAVKTGPDKDFEVIK